MATDLIFFYMHINYDFAIQNNLNFKMRSLRPIYMHIRKNTKPGGHLSQKQSLRSI